MYKNTKIISFTVLTPLTLYSLSGLWLGLLVCSSLEVALFLVLIFRLNWKKVAHEVILVAEPCSLKFTNVESTVSLNEILSKGYFCHN